MGRARFIGLGLILAGLSPSSGAGASGSPSCGDACEATGLVLTVTEITVHLDGLSLDQVDEQWRAATHDLQPASPRLSQFSVCHACGSTELADRVSLRYELTVPLPEWDGGDAVTPSDRSAIVRYIAALQGRANRVAAHHRDALSAVTVHNQHPDDILQDVEAACQSALDADAALLEREGCVVVNGVDIGLAPITSCLPRWKAPPRSRCHVEK